MTERDWLESEILHDMIDHVGTSPGFRKLWLFNAACCRRIAPYFPDDRARMLVELVERRADDEITELEWRQAFGVIVDPYLGNENAHDKAGDITFGAIVNLPYFDHEKTRRVAGACIEVAGWLAFGGVPLREGDRLGMDRIRDAMLAEDATLCVLLRCVVGNPFHPLAFDPAWRTSTVLDLARGVYADRAFDRLPILADALQDAGCDSDDVLSHCRGRSVHARGCWVVDSVLDKA